MELKDWYEGNRKELQYGDLSQSYNRAMENLFVIGPCGDCKCSESETQCEYWNVNSPNAFQEKGYGCIEFEAKEDK